MILDVKNLIKRYKNNQVLKGINIQIEHPQIIALVGPNGSGKTTLLNCIMNLLDFQQGLIEVLGKEHTDTSIYYDVSYLQDNRILYQDLTGFDHLKFICQMQKLPTSKALETAKYVGMESYLKTRVRNYSLGMKQHLLLAMAIINDPKLILLDEPINGLDPTSAIHMRNILLDLHQNGTTIIISSHNLDEIDKLTNTIYFMRGGQLLKESLTELNKNFYIITISDFDRVQKSFTEPYMEWNKTQSTFSFSDEFANLQSILTKLNDLKVTILKIENVKRGAEQRYMELFESELV